MMRVCTANFRRAGFLLAAVSAVALLGGCENPRRTLGLDRTLPDEFAVIARAPLTLPPDFSLRPPQPGALRGQDAAPVQKARQTVFRAPGSDTGSTAALPAGGNGGSGTAAVASGTLSAGELALLRQAGAPDIDPSIRQRVDQEAARLAENDKGFVNTLLFWRRKEASGTVVDAEKENQRLRENAALGKPVTEGDSPSIKRRKKALLEGFF
jgi:hypothetical protein